MIVFDVEDTITPADAGLEDMDRIPLRGRRLARFPGLTGQI
jgi:hypothetical protein